MTVTARMPEMTRWSQHGLRASKETETLGNQKVGGLGFRMDAQDAAGDHRDGLGRLHLPEDTDQTYKPP